MKLTLIQGSPITLECLTCHVIGVGGTDTYQSAATGENRTPEEWYTELIAASDPLRYDAAGIYCAACAAKLVQTDEARSVNQFFSDTAGNEIKSVLPADQ